MKIRTMILALCLMSLSFWTALAQLKDPMADRDIPGALILIDGMRIRHPFQKSIPARETTAIDAEVRAFAERFKAWGSRQSASHPQDRLSVTLWLARGQRIIDALGQSGCLLKEDPQGYCVLVVPSILPDEATAPQP